MSDTPKAKKCRGRQSLTLNQRLTKRLTSPQKRTLSTESSHSSVSISLDNNACTPPHKKLNLDDSYDSPTNYENNQSPSFLSQTFCPDSPEIGWRWSQDVDISTKTNKSTTTDSGISSKSSSSVEMSALPSTHRGRSQSYNSKHGEKTRLKISQLHRADKIRSEAILRERLSKLEDQLKTVNPPKMLQPPKPVPNVSAPTVVTATSDTVDMANFSDFDNIFDESLTLENVREEATVKPAANNSNDIDDFFNDSDADSFLIAATQQVESKLPEVSEPTSLSPKLSTKQPEENTSVPKSNKEKRSSLYMKFLEDDEDDLFVSLDDDAVLKASQSSKFRSPFQRYKSMPAATTTTTSTTVVKSVTLSSSGTKMFAPTVKLQKAPIKRHSSSHAIGTSTTSVRGRQK